MTYQEAINRSESGAGLDLYEIGTNDLLGIIDELPAWDYPLAEELMAELAKRSGIDVDAFFAEADRDYSDLWIACEEALKHG